MKILEYQFNSKMNSNDILNIETGFRDIQNSGLCLWKWCSCKKICCGNEKFVPFILCNTLSLGYILEQVVKLLVGLPQGSFSDPIPNVFVINEFNIICFV